MLSKNKLKKYLNQIINLNYKNIQKLDMQIGTVTPFKSIVNIEFSNGFKAPSKLFKEKQ